MTNASLLEAISRGAQSAGDLAAALGIDEADADRELRRAEGDGLVAVEETERRQVQSGAQDRFLRLTDAGQAELDRLRAS